MISTSREKRRRGPLTIHASDAAHDLGIADPDTLLRGDLAPALHLRLERLLAQRVDLAGQPIEWTGVSRAPNAEDSVRLSFRLPTGSQAAVQIDVALFPCDPDHQTFINIYEDGELRRQAILAWSR